MDNYKFDEEKYRKIFKNMTGQEMTPYNPPDGSYYRNLGYQTYKRKEEKKAKKKNLDDILLEQYEREQEKKKKEEKGVLDRIKSFLGTEVAESKRDDENKLFNFLEGLKSADDFYKRGLSKFANSATFGVLDDIAEKLPEPVRKFKFIFPIAPTGISLDDVIKAQKEKPKNNVQKVTDTLYELAGYAVPGTGAVKAAKAIGLGAKITKDASKAKKALELGKEGAAAGGIFSAGEIVANEIFDPDKYNAKDHAKNFALNTGLGLVGDPALYGAGKGAINVLSRFAKGDVPTFTGKVSDDTLEKMTPTYQPPSFSPKNDVIDNLMKTLRNKPAGVNSQRGNLSDDRISNIMRLLENPSTPKQEKDVVSQIRKVLNIDSLPQSKAIQEGVKGPKQANENISPIGEDDTKDLIDLYGDIDFSKLKDISGLRAYTTDIYRNTEDVFGEHFPKVKETLLDPFDQSKKEFVELQEEWLNKLQKEVVEGLGIKKGSKLSKLVQDYGEKTITLDELKQKAPKDWQRVVEADKWFRKAYDELIDQVNKVRATIYPNNPEKLVPKRKDYYRHFKELTGLEGIRNLFDTPAGIDPQLVGTSDFTKPNTRWASFMQKRGLGPYKSDAVGGFLDYLPAASYAIKIDPHVKKFRKFSNALKKATGESANLNTYIEFLEDFTNDLAGKTNPFDRAPQKVLGRKAFNFLNTLNTRVKKNVLLGNVGTLLAQLGNVPNGVAFAKHHSIPGAVKTIKSLFDKNAPSKQSGFLKERFIHDKYQKFNTRLIEQPEKFLGWLMNVADRVGTTFIWNSAYQKALSEGVEKPIKYADDVTRKLVAGRGIGEVPLAQKAKLTQLIAPFQLEVANLWKVQRDFLKEKDFGALLTLYVTAWMFNKVMEDTRGSGVTFDPLGAIIDAINDEDATNIERVGRLAGEVLSNVPLGQTLANFYPEYGTKNLPTREEFFGDNDPNRFGSGLLIAKGVQDPLAKLALPYGGNQVKKTFEGYEALKKEGIYDRDEDQLKYPVEDDVINRIKGLLFGPSAFKESREYYDNQRRPLSEKQTVTYEKYKDKGLGKQYYDYLINEREIKKIERMINELRANKEMSEKEKQEKFYDLMNRLQELKRAN